jgi:hypothetical protein
MATFEHKLDWDRYWNGPEFLHFRAAAQGLFQVPILYSWNDLVVEGRIDDDERRRTESGATPAAAGSNH